MSRRCFGSRSPGWCRRPPVQTPSLAKSPKNPGALQSCWWTLRPCQPTNNDSAQCRSNNALQAEWDFQGFSTTLSWAYHPRKAGQFYFRSARERSIHLLLRPPLLILSHLALQTCRCAWSLSSTWETKGLMTITPRNMALSPEGLDNSDVTIPENSLVEGLILRDVWMRQKW